MQASHHPSINLSRFSGELVPFDLEKLRVSLYKSGACKEEVEQVIEEILPALHEGMTTRSLYQLAFKQLKKVANSFAARYSLKKALRDLGPAGYYFEKWVARFFDSYGYKTMTGQLIPGLAVMHEADVIAQKDQETYWIECKFRNTVDAKISVTTPMYLLSRIKDISVREYELFGGKTMFSKGWLITNAYLTTDSVHFGEYYGIRMLSWDYPSGSSIKNLVDQKALYPVTCLTTINQKEKEILLAASCVMVMDLLENPNLLAGLQVSKRRKRVIMKEVCELVDTIDEPAGTSANYED